MEDKTVYPNNYSDRSMSSRQRFNALRSRLYSGAFAAGIHGVITTSVIGLLLFVTSLTFISEAHATSFFAPSGMAVIPSNSGLMNTKSVADVDSSHCSSQSYASPPTLYWSVPVEGLNELAMRFTSFGAETLKSVSVAIYDPGDATFGNDTIFIKVYSDLGGLPGNLLKTQVVLPGSYGSYPPSENITLTGPSLVVYGDFHVSFSSSATLPSGDYESLLSDSGLTTFGRSSVKFFGSWTTGISGGFDFDFLISVELCGQVCFANGDANGNSTPLEPIDLVYLHNFIYSHGPAPNPLYLADLNGDCKVDSFDYQKLECYFVSGLSCFPTYPVPTCCDPIAVRVPDSVTIFGLQHVSKGSTVLDTAAGQLTVSNIGMSGNDGVSINLGNRKGWDGTIKGAIGTLPENAFLKTTMVGKVNGFTNRPITSLTAKARGDSLDLLPDWTPLGSNSTQVKLYRSGSQVFSGSGTNLRMIVLLDTIPWYGHLILPWWWIDHIEIIPPHPYTFWRIEAGGLPMPGGNSGAVGTVDEVEFLPASPLLSTDSLERVDITSALTGSFKITAEPIEIPVLHGDADNSGSIDISDAVFLIAYIFAGGPAPLPPGLGDSDCNGSIDISDVVFLIAYIFGGGPAPCITS